MERTRRLAGWLVLALLICSPATAQGQICGEGILSIGGCETSPVQVPTRKAAAAAPAVQTWPTNGLVREFKRGNYSSGLWTDSSGNGANATQTTSLLQPTLVSGEVTFAGGGAAPQELVFPPVTGTQTVVVVFKHGSGYSGRTSLHGDGTPTQTSQSFNSWHTDANGSQINLVTTVAMTSMPNRPSYVGKKYAMALRVTDKGTPDSRLSSIIDGTIASNTETIGDKSGWTTSCIGAYSYASTFYEGYKGEISLFLVYNRLWTDAELRTYLPLLEKY